MNYLRLLSNFRITTDALLANKVRSALTALGIIFGVAAVIAMLAIGNGAQQEILDQIKLVGVNNVVIKPIVEQEEGKVDEKAGGADASQKPKRYSRGLDLEDARSILTLIPTVEQVSPEVVFETDIIRSGLRRSSRIVGVEPAYFEIANLPLDEAATSPPSSLPRGGGMYHRRRHTQEVFHQRSGPRQLHQGGQSLAQGGRHTQRNAGVGEGHRNLGIRDFNMDVYAPIKTVLGRYINRSSVLVPKQEDESFFIDGVEVGGNDKDQGPINYHQLDRLVVQVEAPEASAHHRGNFAHAHTAPQRGGRL